VKKEKGEGKNGKKLSMAIQKYTLYGK